MNIIKPLVDFSTAFEERTVESYDRAHNYILYNIIAVTFITIYGLINFRILGFNLAPATQFSAATMGIFAPLLYRYFGFHFAVAWLLVTPYLSLYGICYLTGGIESPAMFWFGLSPIAGGLIGGKRHAAINYLAGMALIIYIKFYSGAYVDPVVAEKLPRSSIQFRTLIGIISISTYLVVYFHRKTNLSLKVSEEKNSHVRDLLRLVTHDGANLLQIITGRIRLVERKIDPKDEKLHHHLVRMSKAAVAINVVMDQVRAYEAINEDLFMDEMEIVNLLEVIEACHTLFDEKLSKKNLSLVYDKSKLEGIKIKAVRSILTGHILPNIISNAIKFSEVNSQILIECDEIRDYVQIKVTDYGIGIPKRILRNIFDPHANTSRKGTLNELGAGFGMPLVQNFVHKLGGEIKIESWDMEQFPIHHGTTCTLFFKSIKK